MKKNLKRMLSIFLVLAFVVVTCATPAAGSVSYAASSTTSTKAKLSKTKLTLGCGKSTTLTLSGTKVKYVESSNKKVARVNTSLKIYGAKCGKSTITVTGKNGKKYTCKVTVVSALSATKLSVYVGKTATLKLNGAKVKSFTSSNKKIATVSKKGVIKGIKAGTAKITVKDTKKKKYTCTVTVKKQPAQEEEQQEEEEESDECTVTYACTDTISGLTLPSDKTYKKGDKLGELEDVDVAGYNFLGWYYDSEYEKLADADDVVSENTVLYADLLKNETEASHENPFVAALDVDQDYQIQVQADSEEDVKAYTKLTSSEDPDTALGFTVLKVGSYYSIIPDEEYAKGGTYTLTISDTSKVRAYYDDEVKGEECTEYTISIEEPDSVQEMTLNDDIRYIKMDKVSGIEDSEVVSGVDTDDASSTTETTSTTGDFVYKGTPKLAVGETVSLYNGEKPDARSLEDDESGDGGEVMWVVITAVDGYTYTYQQAGLLDVVDVGDIVPVWKSMDTDGSWDDNAVTITADSLEVLNQVLADNNTDRVVAGTLGSDDYLYLTDTELTYDEMSALEDPEASGRIVKITSMKTNSDGMTTIKFRESSKEEYTGQLNVHEQLDADLYGSMTDAQRKQLENDLVQQVEDSGFQEETELYLTGLAVETEGFQKAAEEAGIEDPELVMEDGSPITEEALEEDTDLCVMDKSGNKYNIKTHSSGVKPSLKGTTSKLSGLSGITLSLIFDYTIEITPKDSKLSASKLTIDMTVASSEEIGVKITADADYGWLWGKLTTQMDLGGAISFAITATATTSSDESSALTWKKGGTSADDYIQDISDELEKLTKEDGDTYLSSSTQTLADRYNALMESDESDSIRILEKSLGNVTVSGIKGVLSLNINPKAFVDVTVNVSIGILFECQAVKRITTTVKVSSGDGISVHTDTRQLSKTYSLQIYAMGHLETYFGIEFDINLSFCGNRIRVGTQIDIGPDLNLYGFAYIRVSNTSDSGVWGAIYFTVDLRIKINFYITVDIYVWDKTWTVPIWDESLRLVSFGNNEVITGYTEESDQQLTILDNTTVTEDTLEIPEAMYCMNMLDLTDGEIYDNSDDDHQAKQCDKTDFKGSFSGDDAEKFSYDAKTGVVTVTPSLTDEKLETDLSLTYQKTIAPISDIKKSAHDPLVIHLVWYDRSDKTAAVVDSAGGNVGGVAYTKSNSKYTIKLVDDGASIEAVDNGDSYIMNLPKPVRPGYTFKYYECDGKAVTDGQEFDTATDRKFIAVWEPAKTTYKVEFYKQDVKDYSPEDTYTLVDTVTATGLNEETIDPLKYVDASEDVLTELTDFTVNTKLSDTNFTVKYGENNVAKVYYDYSDKNSYDVTFNSSDEVALDSVTKKIASSEVDGLWNVYPKDNSWTKNGEYTLYYVVDSEGNVITPDGKDVVLKADTEKDTKGDKVASVTFDSYEVTKADTYTTYWITDEEQGIAKYQVECYISKNGTDYTKSDVNTRQISGNTDEDMVKDAAVYGIQTITANDNKYALDANKIEVENAADPDGSSDENFRIKADGSTVIKLYYNAAVTVKMVSLTDGAEDITIQVPYGAKLLDEIKEIENYSNTAHYKVDRIYTDKDMTEAVGADDLAKTSDSDAITVYVLWTPSYSTLTVERYTKNSYGVYAKQDSKDYQVYSGVSLFDQDGSEVNMIAMYADYEDGGDVAYVECGTTQYKATSDARIETAAEGENLTIKYYYTGAATISWHLDYSDGADNRYYDGTEYQDYIVKKTVNAGDGLFESYPDAKEHTGSITTPGKTANSILIGWTDKDTLDSWQENDYENFDPDKLVSEDEIVTASRDLYAVWYEDTDSNYDAEYNVYFCEEKKDGSGEYNITKETKTGEWFSTAKASLSDMTLSDGYVYNEAKSVLSKELTPYQDNDLYIYADLRTSLKKVVWKSGDEILKSKYYAADALPDEEEYPDAPKAAKGYTFAGWEKSETDSLITYTATWELVDYTLTYDAAGGLFVNGEDQMTVTCNYGKKVAGITETPTRDGYTFAGWALEDDSDLDDSFLEKYPYTSDATVYALWNKNEEQTSEGYQVKVYAIRSSGAIEERDTLDETGNISTVAKADMEAIAANYAGCEMSSYKFNREDKSNPYVELYLKLDSFTVTFDSDEGTAVKSQTVDYGYYVSRPYNPVKEGYYFTDWYVKGTNESFSFYSTQVTQDIELEAKWSEEQHTVKFTYDSNGNGENDSTATCEVLYGKHVDNVPYTPFGDDEERDGYIFAGWRDTATDELFDFRTKIYDDIELEAVWEPLNEGEYAQSISALHANSDDGFIYFSNTGTSTSYVRVDEDGKVLDAPDLYSIYGAPYYSPAAITEITGIEGSGDKLEDYTLPFIAKGTAYLVYATIKENLTEKAYPAATSYRVQYTYTYNGEDRTDVARVRTGSLIDQNAGLPYSGIDGSNGRVQNGWTNTATGELYDFSVAPTEDLVLTQSWATWDEPVTRIIMLRLDYSSDAYFSNVVSKEYYARVDRFTGELLDAPSIYNPDGSTVTIEGCTTDGSHVDLTGGTLEGITVPSDIYTITIQTK